MKINYFFVILFIGFVGCTKTDKTEENIEKLLAAYQITRLPENYFVFIIPLEGCGSCIKPAIGFVKNNAQNQHIIFVLSGITKKSITIHFEEKQLDYRNIILETKGKAFQLQLVSTAPVVYWFENKKLVETTTLNSQNSKTVFDEFLNR
jgi:hypothetical protein